MKIIIGTTLLFTSLLGGCAASCHLGLLQTCGRVLTGYDQQHSDAKKLTSVECGVLQPLVDCYVKSKCSDEVANALRYSTLQFVTVFRKLECPDVKYGQLRGMVEDFMRRHHLPDMEFIPLTVECGKTVLRNCYDSFTKESETNNNFCTTADTTLKCFQRGAEHCNSTFLLTYIDLMEQFFFHIDALAEKHGDLCKMSE